MIQSVHITQRLVKLQSKLLTLTEDCTTVQKGNASTFQYELSVHLNAALSHLNKALYLLRLEKVQKPGSGTLLAPPPE